MNANRWAYVLAVLLMGAGMLAPDDPLRASTLATFRPLADFIEAHGFPPERVDTQTGAPGPNAGNAGFSAAVAPYLAALGRTDLASAQAGRSRSLALESPPGYYSQVLMLFGLGYLDGLMRFDAQGRVTLKWPQPGLYRLEVNARDGRTTVKQASERRLGYAVVLEVLSQ